MKDHDSLVLDALLKVLCEIKNNGVSFVNVIDPKTMSYAEKAILRSGWEINRKDSWIPGHDFYMAEQKKAKNAQKA